MNEDIKKIFENVQSELLTEEVQNKIATLIEVKVAEKVNEKTEELDSLFETYKEEEINKLEEKAVQYVDEYLVDKIDEYLNYVADEYMNENTLAIDNSLKAAMYENLIKGVKNVLSENQIAEGEIENTEDIFSANKELSEEVNEKIKTILSKDKEIMGLKAKMVFENVASDLSETDKEKLLNLSSDFDIDNIDEFKSKVETLKESLGSFTSKKISVKSGINEGNEDADEELETEDENLEIGFKKTSPLLESFGDMKDYL